jgi:hypothetical protein
VICVGVAAAIQRYEELATAAGKVLPLDRFKPDPVLHTDDPGPPGGPVSNWTGFVFNQLKPPAHQRRVFVRTDFRDREPWLSDDGKFEIHFMEKYDDDDEEPALSTGPRSTYAWVPGSMFAESAAVIAASGLLDRAADDVPDGPRSDDFRLFRVQGDDLRLSHAQASAVRVYWGARMRGLEEYEEVRALAEAELGCHRLRDLFKEKVNNKSRTSPNFKKLFTKTRSPRCYRLNVSD